MKARKPLHPIEQYAIDAVTALRKEKHVSQQDMSDIIGTSPSFIGNVESKAVAAKYNLTHLNDIAAYFKVSPRIFLPHKAYDV